jgi:hypothetical protein
MKESFEAIWYLALPYQDQRDDPGHAEVTLYWVQVLLGSEGGDEDVAIPAMILHDVGYSQLTKERRLQVFDRTKTKEERRVVQIEHQDAGVKLARELLETLSYPSSLIPEILEIISQHDTREGFISKNEGLVRDADKLWRFSARSFEVGSKRLGNGPDTRLKDLEADIDKPGYFYSERAKQIARQELAARKAEAEIRQASD